VTTRDHLLENDLNFYSAERQRGCRAPRLREGYEYLLAAGIYRQSIPLSILLSTLGVLTFGNAAVEAKFAAPRESSKAISSTFR
jgi:hypothetical protein